MQIKITGNAYALTSKIKVSDIELLKTYKPDALGLRDEDGNDVFNVGYQEGHPAWSKYGITFGGASLDDGFATVTGTIPSDKKTSTAAKEYVAELFGAVTEHLKTLEESIPTAAEGVRASKKQLVDSIVVA